MIAKARKKIPRIPFWRPVSRGTSSTRSFDSSASAAEIPTIDLEGSCLILRQ